MATNTVGIDKEVEVDRKENLRDHRLYWIGRRTQDVILSSLALVVLSPVMLATAIAIVVDDPSAGPVFSQERIGRNGKPFKFYKFRSMCPNAEAKLDDGKILFGEMTFFHWSGLMPFEPEEWDYKFGSWIELPEVR